MTKIFEIPQDAKKGDYLLIGRDGSQVIQRDLYLAISAAGPATVTPTISKIVTPVTVIEQEKQLVLEAVNRTDKWHRAPQIAAYLSGRVQPTKVPARLEALYRDGHISKHVEGRKAFFGRKNRLKDPVQQGSNRKDAHPNH